ncbi:hypothetical protein CXF59_07470 [Flavobacterium sp. ALD4]|uniref:TonB-dependent receptor plug domain-containing protein n=1 Tax=Flavobacterium sp. ALD4 TaxID=2058314 RepID=UPI000C345FAE|nr:TonB-dependent receptor plug domain-containing protein [Flavobacterium sp. ALD4]PKH67730.1 hypothetical protein CXF59_07470 [Flavobacterium sp. ALD4]
MQIILLLVWLFGTLVSMQAQTSVKTSLLENPRSITGKVFDKTSSEVLPYVNIILKEGDKFVTGGITSEKGVFQIKNLNLKNYNVDIGTIALKEDPIELKGVNIISEKSTTEQKIDRKIINGGKDLISAGATASEIMNNIPSVCVDPQTNAISLRGNANVRVLIDGKPSNIDASQLLQQIPSASIKQIELITNPSGKYNPEEMSGIINIVLYKNSKIGLNGSLKNGVIFGKHQKLIRLST